MTGKPGRYLTPEQTARLGIIQSVERDRLIAHIVDRLRDEQKRANGRRMPGVRGRR